MDEEDKRSKAEKRILEKIRKHFGKGPDDDVTLDEYCAYLGIPKDEVEKYLQGSNLIE